MQAAEFDPAVVLTIALVLVVHRRQRLPVAGARRHRDVGRPALQHRRHHRRAPRDRPGAGRRRRPGRPRDPGRGLRHRRPAARAGRPARGLARARPARSSRSCARLVVMLRTRQYRTGTEVLVGLVSGILGLVSVAVSMLWLHPDWRPTAAVVLAGDRRRCSSRSRCCPRQPVGAPRPARRRRRERRAAVAAAAARRRGRPVLLDPRLGRAPMATKKDLVEAYSFSRRRLVTAFVSGAPGGREVEPARPGRTVVGGLALAVLLVAGAAIAGVFAPRTPDDWNQAGLLISKETGAAYVITQESEHPELRPVINSTSAKLILGSEAEPTLISQDTIDDQRIGEDIGILGAPASLPTSSLLVDSGWTACTAAGRGLRVTVAEDPDYAWRPVGASTVVSGGAALRHRPGSGRRQRRAGARFVLLQVAHDRPGPTPCSRRSAPRTRRASDRGPATVAQPLPDRWARSTGAASGSTRGREAGRGRSRRDAPTTPRSATCSRSRTGRRSWSPTRAGPARGIRCCRLPQPARRR